ncbi:hypothetical protein L1D31_04410 [Vibrio sp. Isolate23]|uniref:hypothetical protein n=1 Tax=Vibrio sp. Isolate23 TaxID=2908533 RepID=UPI001EFEC907|nr:hypothetical protein [Vibrio sp. Isolate23]MCG9681805.1 hypothetical protein [Vibrio sp. Isolate23]
MPPTTWLGSPSERVKTTGNAMHSDAFQRKGMSDLRLFTGGKLTIVGDVVLV